MTEGHVEATEGSRGPRRWRYLIDIIVLVAVTFLLDAVLGAFVHVPIDLEKLFVGSRSAWIGACVLQGVLFGAAHAYQNSLGIAITGTLGILMGLLVLASGRNLWAVIIGHGLFDASRFVLFYFQGPPTG